MFHTQVLESLSKPGEYYRGHTSDLKQRLADHNAGLCPRTVKFRPWKVKIYVAFERWNLLNLSSLIQRAGLDMRLPVSTSDFKGSRMFFRNLKANSGVRLAARFYMVMV